MDREKGLGKRIRVSGEGTTKFGFDDYRDCREVLRSLCVVKLETYQEALRMVRRTLDRKLGMRWMLAGLAERHNPCRLEVGYIFIQFIRKRMY